MLLRILIAALAVATPAFAQSTAPNDDIIVQAPTVDERIRGFVAETSQEMASEDQLARWNRRICPGVVGMRRQDQAQFLVDRITQRAAAVGLEVGAPGCTANVLIFVTPESTALARVIAEEYRQLVGYYAGQSAVTQGHEQLVAFAETERPVRWWHVSQTVTESGQILGDTVAIPARREGWRGAQVVRSSTPMSRLRSTTRQDFSRAIIIVDADDAAGVQLASLGDYLAMVTLAQVSMDADLAAAPSILDLFNAPPPSTSLTEWDIAYLDGLYDANRTAISAQAQRREIARTMEERLSE